MAPQRNSLSRSDVFNPRVVIALVLSLASALLTIFSFAANPLSTKSPVGSSLSSSSGWTIVSSPNLVIAHDRLSSVTCTSASQCWAVGDYVNASNASQTLIEQWNGSSWSIVSSPNPSPNGNSQVEYSYLYSVTCASASQCWAVGYETSVYTSVYGNSYFDQPLIEQWDGASWSIVPSPIPDAGGGIDAPTQHSYLNGVTCASTSQCWAVGYYSNFAGRNQTLIEQWDGSSWSVMPSANTGVYDYDSLSGVTCISTSDCWAVGNYESASGIRQTLIEHWDGSSWSIVSSPNTSTTLDSLNGVACTSSSQCWAVGDYYDSNNHVDQTLIEHWDGSSWSIVSSPNATTTQFNGLGGVACTSSSQCWAVGDYYDSNNHVDQTLIEHWDGSSWSIVSSPSTSTSDGNVLSGVACSSASQCRAVGSYGNNTNGYTLTEQWDGSSWSVVSSANVTITYDSFLNAVACTSAAGCWTVGDFDYFANTALIEQWNGSSWVFFPNYNFSEQPYLSGVTCTSSSQCWAVGFYYDGGGTFTNQTLIERWDGSSWSIVSSPNAGADQYNSLVGVTCPSPSECWAVGSFGSWQQCRDAHRAMGWFIVVDCLLPECEHNRRQFSHRRGLRLGLAMLGGWLLRAI